MSGGLDDMANGNQLTGGPSVTGRARFSNKVALVTGAGSGIGRAVATTLASEGAHVHLVGRTKHKLEATAAEFPNGAPAPGVWPLDLNIDASVEQLSRSLTAQVPGLDVLVLAAGELVQGTIAEMPVDQFDRLWASNVRSVYLLVQKVLPLVTARQGQIVFVNSSAGLGARPNGGQYAATKHALKALADALRAEVNAQGVRVLSIYPGRTATPRMERLYADGGQAYRPEVLLQATDVAATVADALSLPRTAEVTDLSIRPLAKSY